MIVKIFVVFLALQHVDSKVSMGDLMKLIHPNANSEKNKGGLGRLG
jgi:hypothetical protein